MNPTTPGQPENDQQQRHEDTSPPQSISTGQPPVPPNFPPQSSATPPAQPPIEPPNEVMQKATANDHRRAIKRSIKGFLSFAGFVATVVIAAMLINQFIFQSYYVDGSSMTPTLHNNDRLIIDKVGKTLSSAQGKHYVPDRGSIVVLDSTLLDEYGRDEQLIKRVIGLPGDTISIKNGVVTVKNSEHPDGFDVDKELGLKVEATYTAGPIEVTLNEGEIYLLGDNRIANGSFDSRSFGAIQSDKIIGRLVARIFPFDQAKVY